MKLFVDWLHVFYDVKGFVYDVIIREIFNVDLKMTEEPTMAEETAEEAAQRANAKRLAANRESKKRKRTEESQQQRENRLAANRESMKRKRAEESQQQRENRFASQREITKRIYL